MTSVASGTQTATIGTEHQLDVETTAGVYILSVDTANLVAGDVLELRLYAVVKASGALNLVYLATYANAQADPVKFSVPVPIVNEIKATLKQTAGTGRNFDWNLLKI